MQVLLLPSRRLQNEKAFRENLVQRVLDQLFYCFGRKRHLHSSATSIFGHPSVQAFAEVRVRRMDGLSEVASEIVPNLARLELEVCKHVLTCCPTLEVLSRIQPVSPGKTVFLCREVSQHCTGVRQVLPLIKNPRCSAARRLNCTTSFAASFCRVFS